MKPKRTRVTGKALFMFIVRCERIRIGAIRRSDRNTQIKTKTNDRDPGDVEGLKLDLTHRY